MSRPGLAAAAAALGTLVGLLLAELAGRVYLDRLARNDLDIGETLAISAPEDPYVRYDSVLGWDNLPGARVGNIEISPDGFRKPTAPRSPRPPGPRLLIVGDSFTFAPEGRAEETYPAVLQRLLGSGAEVVNGGVVAYGVDQMLLRLRRDGPALRPDLVVFSVILDDFSRVGMNIWPSGHARPIFALNDGRLALLSGALPARVPPGERLHARRRSMVMGWRPVLPGLMRELATPRGTPGWAKNLSPLHRALLLAARDEAGRSGAAFLLLLLPREEYLDSPPALYDDILREARESGIETLDLFPLFRRRRGLMMGHPNQRGNEAIAEALYAKLRSWPAARKAAEARR